MVGWGGCECDDLVSNTVIVNAAAIHPSVVSYIAVCIKADVFLPDRPISWC